MTAWKTMPVRVTDSEEAICVILDMTEIVMMVTLARLNNKTSAVASLKVSWVHFFVCLSNTGRGEAKC